MVAAMKHAFFAAALTLNCFSLNQAQETIAPVDPLSPDLTIIAVIPGDADGDLIPDEIDTNPLVPNAPPFTWWVSDVTVGWDLDQTRVEKLESVAGNESLRQRKTSFTIGGGIGGGGGSSHGINADPTAIFLSLLPGGNLLKKSGDGFNAQSHLAVSFELRKSLDRQETVKEIRSEFQRLEKERAIKNRHIEFTVEFFNNTPAIYKFSNFSIPVQTASRQTRAEAICFLNGKEILDFEVPANRPSGYPVRFRAMLSTTQSEQILDALESGDLRLAIERANGRAINQSTQVDEIARRQEIASLIEKNTASLEFRTDENSTIWRIAKNNPATGMPTTLLESIAAVNEMTATTRDPDYIETSGGLIYSVGSFRNSPLNAFEVTNAKNAPLKVLGWTRVNRYGAVHNGNWAHELEKPIGEGAAFQCMPYEVERDDLVERIHQTDPQLTSEWLSLCHYWLNYDAEKRFGEYPLSITEYPLAGFFSHLSSDFAKADFDGLVSAWMKNERDRSRSVDSDEFRSSVENHRKQILDAAFDGYSEAGALLTRIPQDDRGEAEKKAIETSLKIGNVDSAAIESISQLYQKLIQGERIDYSKIQIPDHIYSRNWLGFVRLAECNRGYSPGKVSEACDRAFAYSSDLGNPFAQAARGWLHLNIARFKRSKVIDRAGWSDDRDKGMELLHEAAADSSLAQYVLANTFYSNRLEVKLDRELAQTYLKQAAQADFADVERIYRERYGNN